jgi:quercetin dioxygenase-like cupin family protein/DNA-binding XRE family transcriptional regulator
MAHDSFSLANDGEADRDGRAGAAKGPAADLVAIVARNIRQLRQQAGWSLGELARRSQVGKSTLSGIEAGSGNPGLETLVAISVAFGVPFGTLIAPPPSHVSVLRAGEGPEIVSAGGSFTGRMLASTGRAAETECYRFTLEPPAPYDAEPHPAGVTETVICTRGRLRVGPADATVELRPGDRATFAADQPHRYQAVRRAAELFIVLSYPNAAEPAS